MLVGAAQVVASAACSLPVSVLPWWGVTVTRIGQAVGLIHGLTGGDFRAVRMCKGNARLRVGLYNLGVVIGRPVPPIGQPRRVIAGLLAGFDS